MSGRAAHDAPYWCEENAWHLCAEPRVGRDVAVVVISNPRRSVALWHQRAAAEPTAPVVWDYHVVVAGRDDDDAVRIWDLDTTLGFPSAAGEYLTRTFHPSVPSPLQPRFRLIDRVRWRAEFASDRRHMRGADGRWHQPPPPWPPIGHGHNLDVVLDFDTSTFGPWLERDALPWHGRR